MCESKAHRVARFRLCDLRNLIHFTKGYALDHPKYTFLAEILVSLKNEEKKLKAQMKRIETGLAMGLLEDE